MEESPRKRDKSPKKSKDSKKSKKKSKSRSKSRSKSKKKSEGSQNDDELVVVPSGERRMSVRPKTLHYTHDHESGSATCCFDDFGCKFKGSELTVRDHLNQERVSHVEMLEHNLRQVCKLAKEVIPDINQFVESFDQIYKKHSILRATYGSQLLWKIDDYQNEVKACKEGTKTIIFSPPFSTSKNGYKLTASVALYGDGKAKGKFMSVFVALMKTDHDNLLDWPFHHRITVSLLDQNANPAERQDNVFTIIPNPTDSNKLFLGKPTKQRNPSFGTQTFMPLSVLNASEFIRDDSIFIKIVVEDEDMNYL